MDNRVLAWIQTFESKRLFQVGEGVSEFSLPVETTNASTFILVAPVCEVLERQLNTDPERAPNLRPRAPAVETRKIIISDGTSRVVVLMQDFRFAQ